MKPTPTDTSCPPPGDLVRLRRLALPKDEASRLHRHLRACPACLQIWQKLQEVTEAGQTPPVLHPVEDTNPGQPATPVASSAIVWSSEFDLAGPGGQRPPAPPSPTAPAAQKFPFLAPPQGAGELGWLAHYRISDVLGEGGMGFVFDAFDTHLYRRVALKVLKPELAANLSFRERFLQEARAAAALPDEYIITIYQVGTANETPFLAMKFLHGESLEHRLQREGRLPNKDVLRIGREVALGLSAAHDRGLIHRDVKPANLWLETPPPEQQRSAATARLSFEYVYRVKILDFGLARPINDNRRLTATGLIVGTPQYLAPEQARGQPLDHRCDLFSLGIVLYRMVTGILPFEGPDTLAQLTALAVADPRPVEEVAPDVPAELRQLIHQLLARDPAKRPQTARAVAEMLRKQEKAETLPVDVSVGRASQPVQGRPGKPVLQKSKWFWLLAGGLLGMLLVGGLMVWRGFRPAGAENTPPSFSGEPIKVGLLFSQHGTMARGGRAALDAANLAIDELNQQGGLFRRKIVPVIGDGESDCDKFAAEAERLIAQESVCVLFGTRASSNRKSVLPIVQKNHNLLFYPMQFEGMEDCPNVIYLGATPNQQILPSVDYFLDKQKRHRLFLVGTDYIFSHAANEILRDHLQQKYRNVEIVGKSYLRFGSSDVKETIEAIKDTKPDLIVNTIIGDTNAALFREYDRANLHPDRMPILSFTFTENDLIDIGRIGAGHYAAWSYFQSIDRSENKELVRKFRERFTDGRVVSDPMETVYFGIHLWARAVQAAHSIEPDKVREAVKGLSLEAPEGKVQVDPTTRYTWRPMRLGKVRADGQFETQELTLLPYPPDPFPATRPRKEWERFLGDLYTRWGNRWKAGDEKR